MKKTVKNIQQEEVTSDLTAGIVIKNQKTAATAKSSYEIFQIAFYENPTLERYFP